MKKVLLASLFATATTSALLSAGVLTVAAPAAYAQAAQGSSDQITIKDPAEFNAYQNAITQTSPAAKASACESFLQQYPQSVVKKTVLDQLIDADAQIPNNADKTIDAAQRMLQLDPNNLKSMYLIALLKKQQAAANPGQAAQLLDDAAAMATKGLAATKPADVKQEDWDKQKSATDPVFYSILSNDELYSKKDLKAAIEAFRTELEWMAKNNPDLTKVPPGLNDTLLLGQTYTQLTPPDMINGVWFLTRAENFAPANFKPQIDKQARYWYKRYHGKEDGFEAVLAASANSVFPPDGFTIAPAPTPKDIADGVVASTPDLTTLALQDKEYILANASKDNADKLWATLKDQVAQIPGTIMSVSDDGTQIKIAVTDDAKADKKPDFTINMKKPLTAAEKEKLAVGTDETNLIGTFDSYTQNPEEIIMRDGELQVEKKAPAHKPSAAHHRPSSK